MPDNTLAINDKPLTSKVLAQLNSMVQQNAITIPPDYAIENALQAAWLWIANSENKDKLLACTAESQINALRDMVLQGQDVSKGQGDFIPHRDKMVYRRRYNGEIALAQRVRPGIEIFADVVYAGEKLVQAKIRNKYGFITIVKEHVMLEERKGDITQAYCGVVDENGESMGDEIMTIDQIHTSWKASQTFDVATMKSKFGKPTFHTEQPDIACKRTVIRRRCKPIIALSKDTWLLAAVRGQEIESVASEMAEEVEEKANKQVISLPTSSAPDRAEPSPPSGLGSPAPQGVEETAATDADYTEEDESETAATEAPAQAVAHEGPPATNTQEEAPPAKSPSKGIPVSPAEREALMELLKPSGASYVLFKAQAEKEGVTTYEDLVARAKALGADDEEDPYA